MFKQNMRKAPIAIIAVGTLHSYHLLFFSFPSDLIREGRAAGREEGRNDAIFS